VTQLALSFRDPQLERGGLVRGLAAAEDGMTRKIGWIGAALVLAACSAGQDDGAEKASSATIGKDPGPTTRTGTSRTGTNADGGAITTDPDAGPTTRADAGSAPSCYANLGTCSPTDPGACPADYACDINGSTDTFQCFEPPNDAQLGEACNNSQGPFCGHGLACHLGTCAQYCCDDSGCAAGTTCVEAGVVGPITIRLCQ
jgi:hypothetical protein